MFLLNYSVPNITYPRKVTSNNGVPWEESTPDCTDWDADDNKDSSLAYDPSDGRRGVQTTRSDLSLFLVRFSCFSPGKQCNSLPTSLSSGAPFASFKFNCTCWGRGGRLSFSKFEVCVCCSDWAPENRFWRESLFKSMLLIILPLASRRWLCLRTELIRFLSKQAAFCCDIPPDNKNIHTILVSKMAKYMIVGIGDDK